MRFKRAFFLGGAVLLVTACSSATAPTAQVQAGSAAAAAKAPASQTPAKTTATAAPLTASSPDGCFTNIPLTSGRDSTCTIDQ